MKIPFMCIKCIQEGEPSRPVRLIPVDSGLYDVRCEKGHSTQTVLQQMRFEILFEIGVHAIADGYLREAISSFAAALERFFEFYIQMVFLERGSDSNLRTDVWKLVASQSERQLGAYMFLCTIHENATPPCLTTNQANFRNRVIHKGSFPTEDEAIDFGNIVINIMNPIVRRLKERSPQLLVKAVMEHQAAVISNAREQIRHGQCVNTMISLSHDPNGQACTDIRDRVNELKIFQRMP